MPCERRTADEAFEVAMDHAFSQMQRAPRQPGVAPAAKWTKIGEEKERAHIAFAAKFLEIACHDEPTFIAQHLQRDHLVLI